MKIIIKYDSSWRNSFLDGNNNEPLPKKGRKYIASMTSLKKNENFIKRDITKDTVMGILNRLIGDQRKLYQSRQDESYYFRDVENKINFDDKSKITNEMTYLRNISSGIQYDQNSFTGSIVMDDVIFSSDYSNEFWGVLTLDFEQLCNFIINDEKIHSIKKFDPLLVVSFFESLKIKPVKNEGIVSEVVKKLHDYFNEDINYENKKEEIVPLNIYCSALYLQLYRLSNKYDMDSAKTPSGGIKGISKRLFTKKDFMDKYVSGGKKIIYGNPYIQETFIKGEGKTKNLMRKASGSLNIVLDIPRQKAENIREMINNAGVSSFYLGKKGLAFVDDINVLEETK